MGVCVCVCDSLWRFTPPSLFHLRQGGPSQSANKHVCAYASTTTTTVDCSLWCCAAVSGALWLGYISIIGTCNILLLAQNQNQLYLCLSLLKCMNSTVR